MNYFIRKMWAYFSVENIFSQSMKRPTSYLLNLSKAVTTMALITAFVVFVFYYNMFNLISYFRIDRPFYEMSAMIQTIDTDEFILETTGCVIPNFTKKMKFKESAYYNKTCGNRAIFVTKISHDTIIFEIRYQLMKEYSKGKRFNCCYKYAYRSTESGKEDTEIKYSTCKGFKNGTIIELEQEAVTVSCSIVTGKKQTVIYEDAYLIIKKLNIHRNESWNKEESWNVLLVGMDTMSRARVYETMPKTISYMQKHKWLDFRGYQKVGLNTFPNVMSLLTGKKISSVYKACAKGMTDCNELMLWSKYSDAGYFTAYGEEYLRLPDTFARYKGYRTPPTNHYARQFFLTGEEKSGNYICTGKKPSAFHLLDYALDFTNTYVKENFFGMFWLNSFSHNLDNMPALMDEEMVHFFENLEKTNALNNTFIVFISDHGIRYGETRLSIESYYEERLPMFFMFVPFAFQEKFAEEYNNLKINQNRLSSTFDLHLTIWNILKLANNSIEVMPSEACPECTSLFYEKTTYRTCAEAGVSDKWCSCHKMTEVNGNDAYAKQSLQLAVSYIQNKTRTIETTQCMECETLELKTVLRHHFYVDEKKVFYIVAFLMMPGDVAFEANVVRNEDHLEILQPTDTISAYNIRGNCVKNSNYRSYCVCKNVKNCNKKHKKYLKVFIYLFSNEY